MRAAVAAVLLASAHALVAPPRLRHQTRIATRPSPRPSAIANVQQKGSTTALAAEPTPYALSDTKSEDLATLASLPIIWALMVVVMRVLSDAIEPVYCVLWSQALTLPYFAGAALLSPADEDKAGSLGATLATGSVLGLLWALGALVQNTGFEHGASASHGAFLTQMTTLLVPTFSMLRGDAVPRKFLYACALALPGIACFTFDAGSGGGSSSLDGDALCALAAVVYSSYDLYLASVGDDFDGNRMNFARAVFGTGGAAAAAVAFGSFGDDVAGAAAAAADNFQASSAAAVAFLPAGLAQIADVADVVGGVAVPAIGLPVLACLNLASTTIQPKAHAAVPPAVSQIFYAQTPMWASLLAFLLLRESFSPSSQLGIAAFTLSLAVAAAPDDALATLLPSKREAAESPRLEKPPIPLFINATRLDSAPDDALAKLLPKQEAAESPRLEKSPIPLFINATRLD